MEALTTIFYGTICCLAGMVTSFYYTRERTKLNIKARFKDYFENHKNIGYKKSKDLI